MVKLIDLMKQQKEASPKEEKSTSLPSPKVYQGDAEPVVEDQRQSSRAHQPIEIVFKDTESFIKAYIGNVGGGGLFIKTDESIELHETLVVRFYLPHDQEPLTAEGKVVWVTPKGVKNSSYPPGLGLKFIHINPEDKKRLDDFVSKVPF